MNGCLQRFDTQQEPIDDTDLVIDDTLVTNILTPLAASFRHFRFGKT
jgi:hypothetical protein